MIYDMPFSLLGESTTVLYNNDSQDTADQIDNFFDKMGIPARVDDINAGVSVTKYFIQLLDIRVLNKVSRCTESLQLFLGVPFIRVEINDKLSFEIPNRSRQNLSLVDTFKTRSFAHSDAHLPISMGHDLEGRNIVYDLAKMPHLLIAGTTGSGKSVFINSLIISLIYHLPASKLRFFMIDPKRVELSAYKNLPHVVEIANDQTDALRILQDVNDIMSMRYKKLEYDGCKNIKEYNQKHPDSQLPRIVVIIDEFADLMMTSAKETEQLIARIAQLARACGIHLVIATQRPVAKVITGLIKSNLPTRVAFSVASGMDSRIILDKTGAEKLTGRGDMLLSVVGGAPQRIQAPYISSQAIDRVVEHVSGLYSLDRRK